MPRISCMVLVKQMPDINQAAYQGRSSVRRLRRQVTVPQVTASACHERYLRKIFKNADITLPERSLVLRKVASLPIYSWVHFFILLYWIRKQVRQKTQYRLQKTVQNSQPSPSMTYMQIDLSNKKRKESSNYGLALFRGDAIQNAFSDHGSTVAGK